MHDDFVRDDDGQLALNSVSMDHIPRRYAVKLGPKWHNARSLARWHRTTRAWANPLTRQPLTPAEIARVQQALVNVAAARRTPEARRGLTDDERRAIRAAAFRDAARDAAPDSPPVRGGGRVAALRARFGAYSDPADFRFGR